MHFCDCYQLFAEFNATVQQMCVVLKSSKKYELCTRHERFCDVAFNADCKKISVSQNFALLIIIRKSRRSCHEAHKNSTIDCQSCFSAFHRETRSSCQENSQEKARFF